MAAVSEPGTSVRVFVDGACRNNGQLNPVGGCGIYWGELHPLNTQEGLQGERQTNNRAELSAAIIAITQACHIGMTNIEICTDSKYVKEGITKWIVNWKSNNWKTARQKTDVLNKDLWTLLDNLCTKLVVNWRWVLGHDVEDGNLIADDMAKAGIKCETTYWQSIALANVESNITGSDVRVIPKVATKGEESIQYVDTNCKMCTKEVINSGPGIQCMDCKNWFHYTCTDLPAYQLYVFEVSNRKYSCEECSGMDQKFQAAFQALLNKKPTSNSTILVDAGTNTEINTAALTQNKNKDVQASPQMKDKMTSTKDIIQRSEVTKTSDVRDQAIQATEYHMSIDNSLKKFQDSTIQALEKSFVDAVEKLAVAQNHDREIQSKLSQLNKEN